MNAPAAGGVEPQSQSKEPGRRATPQYDDVPDGKPPASSLSIVTSVDIDAIAAAEAKPPQPNHVSGISPSEPSTISPAAGTVCSNSATATTIVRSAAPTHDIQMASRFLANLDAGADRFTFQFFGDGPYRHAEIVNGTLDEVWPKILALNTSEKRIGAFVTINQTDLRGRGTENILRPRALFVDADTTEQISNCINGVAAVGATPSMIVKSGRGLHFYWLSSDIPLDEFSSLQKRLIEKLGTDKSIHDLPHVMRLPGTLHLKDDTKPRPVNLLSSATPVRWKCSELVTKFDPLTAPETLTSAVGTSNVVPFVIPDWARKGPSPAFAHLPIESLSDGLDPDIEQIRSAAAAIPAAAITTESDWTNFARALAHEAAVHTSYGEQLWEILDAASSRAPGYNQEDNRDRFLRYTREAFNHSKPITIATLFHMALDHGWAGRSPSNITSSNVVAAPVALSRAIHVSGLPLIPAKRQWLHGTDLIRGAVTVLVAPGGRAKSTWLLACGLACASGRPLLSSHIFGGPLRVLCLSTEDGTAELALRLRAAMRHYGLSDTDVPGLFVIGADRWGLPLLQADGNRAILDDRGLAALTAELDHARPDVLIIDPLITIMGGVSANDNAAAALLMGQLTALATTRRIAVALAHHAAKGRDPASAESAMGAASFINLARVALAIEPLDEQRAAAIGVPPWDAKSIFRIVGTKQNFAPPSMEDRWYRVVSIDIPNADPPIYMNGDRVAVVEPFQPGVSASAFPVQLIRDALLAVDNARPPLSPNKRSCDRYAAPVITDAIACHRNGRVSDIEGKAVLDHLLRAGLVIVDDVKLARAGSRSDTRKGLVLSSAGKAAIQTTQTALEDPALIPQSPHQPASSMQDDAGGDPLGSPATQGGCGGNTGTINNGRDAPQMEDGYEHDQSAR